MDYALMRDNLLTAGGLSWFGGGWGWGRRARGVLTGVVCCHNIQSGLGQINKQGKGLAGKIFGISLVHNKRQANVCWQHNTIHNCLRMAVCV